MNPSYADKGLAVKNNCLACHAVKEKILGPSFQAVAQKYANIPDAQKVLMQHIMQGGSGRWGDIPMPPQTQLSPTEASQLASWILKGSP